MGQLPELPLGPATSGDYTPTPYDLTEPASALSSVPRFTSSHCMEDLFDSAVRSEYLAGLLSGSVFVMCVYLLWTLVLLALKCLGPRRVGCASGTPSLPSKPVDPRATRNVNPYEEGADEDFLAEVAAELKRANVGEEEDVGIGADDDGIYEAAHRARYGSPGGSFNSADDYGGGTEFTFGHDTVTSEIAFGEEEDRPRKGHVAPFPGKPRGGVGAPIDDYEEALAEWERRKRRHDRRMAVTRAFFLLSGCAVIAGSVLFYVKGVMGLGRSIQSAQDGVQHAQSVIIEAYNLTVNFINAQYTLRERLYTFESIENVCPSLFQERSQTAFPPGAETNGTIPGDGGTSAADEAADAIRHAMQNASQWAKRIGDQVLATARDLQNGLEGAAHEANRLNQRLNNLYPWLWTSVSIAATVDLVILSFIISVVLCGCKCNASCIMQCFRHSLCMPMLLLFTLLSWICAGVFLLGAVSVADFCIAPDVHVTNILENMREDALSAEGTGGQGAEQVVVYFAETAVYDLVLYYVRQCQKGYYPDNVYGEIQKFAVTAGEAANGIDEFFSSLANAPPGGNLESICGDEEASLVMNAATALHTQLHVVWDALAGALGLLSCGNFNPIYNSISHDAVCVNGQTALAWIFATSLSIAVFSMTMVSLRAAWHTAKTKQHVFKSAEDEERRRRKGQRGKVCARVLWALLVALMLAALGLAVYYGHDGFQTQSSSEQCPAEQRQFSPFSSGIGLDGNTQTQPTVSPPSPTPVSTISPRPTFAPSPSVYTVANASSEQPAKDKTQSSPTATPSKGSMDASTETTLPPCTGRKKVLHKVVFEGLDGLQTDVAGMIDGVDFGIKTERAGSNEDEIVYNVPLGSKEQVVCLVRQTCYSIALGGSSAASLPRDLEVRWQIQQMDPSALDAAAQPTIIASGRLPVASAETCTFTVLPKNPTKEPVCPTKCSSEEPEGQVISCKRKVSTPHQLVFLPVAGDGSPPKAFSDAAVEISTRLPSGGSKVVRTVRFDPSASREAAQSYFCLRSDRCYTATVSFPTGSPIGNEGSSLEWQVLRAVAEEKAGEVGERRPVASGVIGIAQGPADGKQCTFALPKSSGETEATDSSCPTTCGTGAAEGSPTRPDENIFNDSADKRKKKPSRVECIGRKAVLHKVTFTGSGRKSLKEGASLMINQDKAGGAEEYTVPVRSAKRKKFVCLKRQQCYRAVMYAAPAGDLQEGGIDVGWTVQEVEKGGGRAPTIVASGGIHRADDDGGCTFTVRPKNPSAQPVCPTTCTFGQVSWRGAPESYADPNGFDPHRRQRHFGVAETRY